MTAKEAQNILELEAPFSVVELKSAHKSAVVTWFPAQFMSDRAQLAKALERTALIHEAYDLLLAHCEAEKAAAPNAFVEEALKQAYGQTPATPSRTEGQPYRAPVLEPQIPAPVEPPPREENALSALPSSPTALRFDEPQPEGTAPALASPADSVAVSPGPVANPFLHEIVPLKVASEAPKVELRGKGALSLEPLAAPEVGSSATSPLSPRTDSAITKVRPPKVIISPRLRGATVQPAMPVATMPVPLPPLSAPVPAVAPLPPPPAAPVIVPLVASEPVAQPVKAEAPAPAPAVTPVPVVPEVALEAPAPAVEPEAKAPEPPAPMAEPQAKAREPFLVPTPILAPVSPEPVPAPPEPAPAVEPEAKAPEPAPALAVTAVAEVAPAPAEPAVEPEAKAPEPETAPPPTPEPPAPVKDEAPVVTPEPAVPAASSTPVPAAERAESPETSPALKRPEAAPAPAPSPEPVSEPVEKPEAPVAEIPPPPSPPTIAVSPEPASAPAAAAEPVAPSEPVHGVPAAIAEETSAVEQASHHAPVAATPPAAHAHPANYAPAPIARPHPPASANGTTKTAAEAEADDQPAGDHALVPALGDRYHPAEKEASPNTDTTRHFPTRPFAPSSGTSPIHEEGKASSSADKPVSEPAEAPVGQAPRSLSAGQRILRFVLAVLCVGGVGYGIFLVSQTEVGKDPWGTKPGSGGPVDRLNHQVLEKLKRDADEGIARAQFDLAKAYQNGKGVPENPEEALKWFQKAAEQGHMDAQNAVGDAYRNGWGVPQDNAQALKWYRMAEATREEQRGTKKEKGKEEEEDLRLQ